MYRLLKVRNAPININYTKSLQPNVQTTTMVCSFCRFAHLKITKSTPTTMTSYLQHRHATTTINTLSLDPKSMQIMKKKNKRYAELLEVSGTVTNNRKASVKKLNAAHLAILVDQPDITLDKLHKITPKHRRTKNKVLQMQERLIPTENEHLLENEHLQECEQKHATQEGEDESTVIEDLQESGILDHTSLIKNSALLDTLQENGHKNVASEEAYELQGKRTAKDPNDTKKNRRLKRSSRLKMNIDLIKKRMEEYLILKLHAYLQVCIDCGMISQAHTTLMRYRTMGLDSVDGTKIRHISLFNLILGAYATSPNIPAIKDLLSIIKQDSIKPSPETYAAVFESLGRLKNRKKKREFFETVRQEMEENGITFNDVLTDSKFTYDKKEYTIQGIKFLEPDFQQKHNTPDFSYDCNLLKGFKRAGHPFGKSPAENVFPIQNLQERLAEQMKNEVAGEIGVKSIQESELTPAVHFCRKVISDLEETWSDVALKAFRRNLNALKNRERAHFTEEISLFPYFQVLDEKEYVKAIMSDIRRLADGSETFSPTLPLLYLQLGRHLNERYEVFAKQRCGIVEKMEKVYSNYCEWYLHPDNQANSRIAWKNIERKFENEGASLDAAIYQWPNDVCYKIGKFLYGIILKDIKLNINCIRPTNKEAHYMPAFYTLFRFKNKHVKEEIKPHPAMVKLYRESKPETLKFRISMAPSVCPPKPWSDLYCGGYLVAKSDIIRITMDNNQQWQRLKSTKPKQLWPILDSLNQLSSVPWTINTVVLDLIIKIFQAGGSKDLNVPEHPSRLPAIRSLQPGTDPDEKIKVARMRVDLRRKKAEFYSIWCDTLYRLSLANHYRDTAFWLPHNIDFRGRVYPIPPHLNHLGSDLARSLLIFAKGKPLGPNGLDWLKIHVINLTGLKKRDTISERLKYANENIDKILDSAENPLNGKMWWKHSEEPWQTLATCMEIAKALKEDDPEKYVCHFPVHQDGSCNGLQHYAALGRDRIGAENVNLCPLDRPQDVYSSVATMINTIRERDAANGLEVAAALEGFVTRKVIKQTVMTTVYGVTKYGARLQIARQLKDISRFPEKYLWSASLYLMERTFESLGTMFKSARAIQDWFTECARIIASREGKPVEWVTPLGLPVIQTYMKQEKLVVQGTEICIERPNTVKQKNAFAPNFIHSLDSSHMMLTSLNCEKAGLTFASVHDCYWTHPSTVATMNRICREEFIALHSEPILEELSRYFLETYANEEYDSTKAHDQTSQSKTVRTFTSIPRTGDFDVKLVLNSTYFFS